MTQQDDQILKVDALGRVHSTKEWREAVLDEFERTGMPGTRFAQLHGIKYPTFASWVQKRKRSRGQYPEAPSLTKPESGSRHLPGPTMTDFALVELPTAPATEHPTATHTTNTLQITLPDGTRLGVADETQARLAALILAEISQASNPTRPC